VMGAGGVILLIILSVAAILLWNGSSNGPR